MNLKLVTIMLLSVFAVGFSACSEAKSGQSEEVVFDSRSGGSKDDVTITNADLKPENSTVSTTTTGGGLGKRFLTDKSYVETIIDGFGNKIETRYFPGNPQISMVILRSSPAGNKEVTVYGNKGDTKLVTELGDNALTASADEIAGIADLSAENKFTTNQNFMKGQQTAPATSTTSATTLQPLPSSSFQQPVQQYQPPIQQNPQPVATVEPQNPNTSETQQSRQTNPDDED